jgi:gliding motility-associated-like protein
MCVPKLIRYVKRVFSLLLGVFGLTLALQSQDFSNKGKDFWVVYPDHIAGLRSAIGIYVTSDKDASGTIYAGTHAPINFAVKGNSVQSFFFGPNTNPANPSNAPLMNLQDRGVKNNAGIRVTSTDSVVVYAHIIESARSGASLILPVNVLENEYIIPSYPSTFSNSSTNQGFPAITIVAPEPDTWVEIETKVRTRDGVYPAGTIIKNIELKTPGDVYQIQFEAGDISGTRVKSIPPPTGPAVACKPIAVFSSTSWTSMGCVTTPTTQSGDNLFQQLVPKRSWGRVFITAPFINRPYDMIRVFVDDPGTQVSVTNNGTTNQLPLATLSNNSFYDIPNVTKPLKIEADKPISVVQYMVTQSCDLRNPPSCIVPSAPSLSYTCPFPGDPEMVILNPVEQTINNITVFSAHRSKVPLNQSNVDQCYFNIIMKTSEASSFRINGNVPSGTFIPIPGTEYSYLQENVTSLAVSNPIQNLKADAPFSAIAYGYGQVESYGYNAGASFKDLSQVIEVNNVYATAPFPATCTNTPFGLSIVLPYQPTKMTWNSTLLGLSDVINSPVPDGPSFILNGVPVWRYRLPKTFQRSSLGDVPVTLLTEWPSSTGCGILTQTIDYSIRVFDPPKAEFDFTSTGCVNENVQLTDKTTITSGRPIINYNWDLGDGTVRNGVIPNLSHTYASRGTKPVKLTVITDVGCVSDPMTKNIDLAIKPLPNFTVSTLNCPDVPITLTDASVISGETIVEWRWDEGSGTVSTSNTGAPRTVSFPAAGNRTFSLTLKTNTGCLSGTVSKTIPVHPAPVVDFELPEICIRDNRARFKDKSTISDGSSSLFRYQWELQGMGIKTDKDPEYSGFPSEGDYRVKLQVTSNNGCKDEEEKVFTVNGGIPIPKFDISNAGVLCSNQEVKLTNRSTVSVGKLARLEIFWDPLDPTSKTTDEDPEEGKVYAFKYPNFGNPATKNIPIRLVAYTGTVCQESYGQTVLLNGSPQLTFSLVDEVCQESPGFDMTGGIETSGIAGTSSFRGPGVTGSMTFNPGIAGFGNHTIRYTYTTTAGCTDFLEESITVNPSPIVDAGQNLTVLEGESVTIPATSRGTASGVRFLWMPTSGLDDPSKLTPLARPSDDTRYLLTATSDKGCVDTSSLFIKLLFIPVIPNTFTPNNDGVNDRWEIRHLDAYPGAMVEVYNSVGQLIYRSRGYATPWDGTVNGKRLPAGTYYYVIDPKNNRKKVAGYLTILF